MPQARLKWLLRTSMPLTIARPISAMLWKFWLTVNLKTAKTLG
jgi:hypothetical protein